MARRNPSYYAMKALRVSGWVLFLLVLVYIVTGFAVSGKLNFDKVLDKQIAAWVHLLLAWPLVALFFVHSTASIYFAFRRWGWLGHGRVRKDKPDRARSGSGEGAGAAARAADTQPTAGG